MSYTLDFDVLLARLKTIPQWAILLGVALITRFINLGLEPIWYDESFTAWLAKLNWSDSWKAIQGDVHPPLWYLLEWGMVHLFGSGAYSLRLLSAIFSTGAIFLVWLIARRFKPAGFFALVCGVLAALLPGSLYYAQDARMYPMLAFFVLAFVYLPFIRTWWADSLWLAAGLGAVYSHHWGLIYVGVIGLALVFYRIVRREWLEVIMLCLYGLVILVGYFPWIPYLVQQMELVKAGFWIQPLSTGGIFYPIMAIQMGSRMHMVFALHAYAAALGMDVISLIVFWRYRHTDQFWLVLACVLFAPLAGVLISFQWRSVYIPRALFPAALLIMIPWAVTLWEVSQTSRKALLAILIPALAVGVIAHYFPAYGRDTLDKYISPIAQNWDSQDVVYYMQIDGAILTNYYAQKPYALLPEATDLSQSLTPQTKQAMGLKEIKFNDLKAQGYKRAWLIMAITPMVSSFEIDQLHKILRDYPYLKIFDETSDNQMVQSIEYLIYLD